MKSSLLASLVSAAVVAQASAQEFKPASYSVGFDLGQSFLASAVYFKNGTTVNLARIAGDQEYTSMMLRLSRNNNNNQPDLPPRDEAWLAAYWRTLKRHAGLAPSEDAAVLERMVRRLKRESEAALNETIVRVAVAAPVVRARDDGEWWDGDLTDALLGAGLEPTVSGIIGEGLYLSDGRATLVDLDLDMETCKRPGKAPLDGKGRPVLYINFDESSLYTEMFHTGCNTAGYPPDEKSSLVTTIGIDDWSLRLRPPSFWLDMKLHLYGVAWQYLRWLQTSGHGVADLGTVVAAGHIFDVEFNAVLADVVADMKCMATSKAYPDRCVGKGGQGGDKDGVELVFADNWAATYIPARGAARWGLGIEEEAAVEEVLSDEAVLGDDL